MQLNKVISYIIFQCISVREKISKGGNTEDTALPKFKCEFDAIIIYLLTVAPCNG